MRLTSNLLLNELETALKEGTKEGWFGNLRQDCYGRYHFHDIYYIEFALHDFLIYLMGQFIRDHDYYGWVDFQGNQWNLDGSIPFKDYAEEKQFQIFSKYFRDFSYLEGDLRDFANNCGGY